MADPRKEAGCPIFARFLKPPKLDADEAEQWKVKPKSGTVYLVCTSAGEVGVNISADHLVCDLTTFDSMAQRFGRVNRFGDSKDTRIHVVYPAEFEDDELGFRRKNTLRLLERLNGNACPKALGDLPLDDRLAAFAPKPTILPTSDILFDAWALTTIKGTLPGRPPIEPYLHGIEDDRASETHFAWREEVALLSGKVDADDIEELLEHAPLRPHELLRVTTFGRGRAYDQLQRIADRAPCLPVWIIEPDGSLIVDKRLSDLVVKRGTGYAVSLAARTVILPPRAGGLTANGALDGGEAYSEGRRYDVAGLAADTSVFRFSVHTDPEGKSWLEPVASIANVPDGIRVELTAGTNRYRDLNAALRQAELLSVRPKFSLKLANPGDDADETRAGVQEYLILQPIQPKQENENEPAWPALNPHLDGVRRYALSICERLKLEPNLIRAIELSGAWHDLGKGRSVWQRGAGNDRAHLPVAKTIHGRAPENLNRYRHELGSLVDVCGASEFAEEFERLDDAQRDIVLHLIAAHHGRARPHFPKTETIDLESPSRLVESLVPEVPQRFARLQRKYGRWGLAYLESILRAADALDSARIEATPLGEPIEGDWPPLRVKSVEISERPILTPTVRVRVDPYNPGQFFACCGLLEIADRLCPEAVGWFEAGEFRVHAKMDLAAVLAALADCKLTNTMTSAEHARHVELSEWSGAKRKSTPGVEDEYKELCKLVREAPIMLHAPIDIRVDWFTDDFAGGSRFKTWAGQQSVLGIATGMKEALKETEWRNEDCLTFSARECGLPFNFDSDLGSQGGAIDVGFSFDPLAASALTRIATSARPALELLAFIGLQRFRPAEFRDENRFLYTAWTRPLPVELAMPAACGAVPVAGASRYAFRLLYRTKYLKSFLPAIPFSGGSNE